MGNIAAIHTSSNVVGSVPKTAELQPDKGATTGAMNRVRTLCMGAVLAIGGERAKAETPALVDPTNESAIVSVAKNALIKSGKEWVNQSSAALGISPYTPEPPAYVVPKDIDPEIASGKRQATPQEARENMRKAEQMANEMDLVETGDQLELKNLQELQASQKRTIGISTSLVAVLAMILGTSSKKNKKPQIA